MKKLKFLIQLIAALMLPLTVVPIAGTLSGCASYEQAAYRSVGVTDITVHNAMLGWGKYVQSGRATAQEIVAVQKHYEKYQSAMAAAETAALSAANAPEGQTMLETALKAAEAATGELTTLIAVLTRN